MEGVTNEQELAIIDNLIAQWKQALYRHTVEMRVYKEAKFDDLYANAETSAKRTQVIIDGLEREKASITVESEQPPAPES